MGLFFTPMHKRHQRKCTLITSNLGFSECRSFFENPHMTAALIGRLKQNSYEFNMSKCHALPNSQRRLNADIRDELRKKTVCRLPISNESGQEVDMWGRSLFCA